MKLKTVAAVAIIEGLILLLVAVNALGLLTFCLPDLISPCGGEIYARAPSPDKTLVAYAFERDCGATTGSTTFVILKSAGEKLDLTKDLDKDEIVFQADGDFRPQIRWTSPSHLQISFAPAEAPRNGEINFQVVKTGDKSVEYHGLK